MSYARRVDANQAEIVAALRACGVAVHDLSWAGRGVPDLVCHDALGTFFVELKVGREQLTEAEAAFWDTWPGDKYILRDLGEALALVNRRRAAAETAAEQAAQLVRAVASRG